MDILSKFSERLEELLFEKQINVTELAKAIQVTKMTVYRYISTKRMPEIGLLIKICDFFGCSLDFLLGITETNHNKIFLQAPNFSERFQYILNHYKTTEFHLHKATGISRSVLYSWLSGKALPTAHSLVRLAQYFDCSVDYLIGREN